MWRSSILACSSCHNKSHCEECRAYSNSPIAFKASVTNKLSKLSKFKRTSALTEALPIESHSICTGCDSKNCFGCTMYNTQFIKG